MGGSKGARKESKLGRLIHQREKDKGESERRRDVTASHIRDHCEEGSVFLQGERA